MLRYPSLKETIMAKDGTKAELQALRRQVEDQVKLADRLGKFHLAALLCEVEACIDDLLNK
jgi:hypothetical protein